MSSKNYSIAVVGAGVVGLTTATFLQDDLPNAQVTIIAEKFLTETTSDGAAGLYKPSLRFPGPSLEVTKKWLTDSFKFYDNFLKQHTPEDARKSGLIRLRVYMLATENPEIVKNAFLEKLLDDYRFLARDEIQTIFESDKYKYGSTFTTLLIECRKWLPYLTKKFEDRGGRIIKRKIESFEELSDRYDLVFNCTGLGSCELCQDRKMVPLRGQVFKVRAPWIQHVVYVDTDTYIIPGADGLITLGSTRQYGSTNLEVDKHDAAGIWERCTSVLPSLKNGKIERQWVGLRPHRTEVRVEREVITFPSGRSLKVIHNYGHGSSGVLSAAGTAMHAVSLGLQDLRKSTSKL